MRKHLLVFASITECHQNIKGHSVQCKRWINL
jgi:hypothetical protein